MSVGPTAATPVHRERGVALRWAVPAVLLVAAAAGWWWSFRMADEMTGGMDAAMSTATMAEAAMEHSMSFAAFALAWMAMMSAMMLPAIAPVIRLYGLAAAKGRVAPLPFFAAAYLAVWGVLAIPSYVVWRELRGPIADGATSAGYLAGGVLLAAAIWQLTPLKSVCLRHCRSPMSFFLRHGSRAVTRVGAFRMGAAHGLFCLGCCWALMAVLVALGTMNLAWMAILAGLIFLEKNAPAGQRIAIVGAIGFALAGVALLVRPALLTSLT